MNTETKLTPTEIDFKSLAFISQWSIECWRTAYQDLVDFEPPIDNLDRVWSFVVRMVFKTPASPTSVVDLYFEILEGWFGDSQVIHAV